MFYVNLQDKEPKGIIPLENIQVRELLPESTNRQNCFELFSVAGNEVIKACKVDSDGKVVEGEKLCLSYFFILNILHLFWKMLLFLTGQKKRLKRYENLKQVHYFIIAPWVSCNSLFINSIPVFLHLSKGRSFQTDWNVGRVLIHSVPLSFLYIWRFIDLLQEKLVYMW